ncbi:vgr related protein [Novosphingobium humi]|uniref:vgr related protein n=1 Tax=Novosphingobium humi TaxID=2282397 RepID=UPI0025AF64AD|nr:vgr related protein [Novosphingobium humi]WJS98094.1 vgr related protein [Novosphingobium humi]
MPRPAIRPLTPAEKDMTAAMFGPALDPEPVRVIRRRWWWFQPRNVVMAPRGHLHFHPDSRLWHPCFAQGSPAAQGLFIHEMAHVWQHQAGMNLLLRRMPFCRYDYVLRLGAVWRDYNVEQQAEIIRHTFLLRQGASWSGAPPLADLERLLPFGRAK